MCKFKGEIKSLQLQKSDPLNIKDSKLKIKIKKTESFTNDIEPAFEKFDEGDEQKSFEMDDENLTINSGSNKLVDASPKNKKINLNSLFNKSVPQEE